MLKVNHYNNNGNELTYKQVIKGMTKAVKSLHYLDQLVGTGSRFGLYSPLLLLMQEHWYPQTIFYDISADHHQT
jgi:hypothetical protein